MKISETKLWRIAFWISFVIAVFIFIWYVIGDSPTLEHILLGIFIPLVIKNSIGIGSLKADNKWTRKSLERIESKL